MTVSPAIFPSVDRPTHQRRRRILPGFGLSLGYTLFYLSIIVLIPLAALVLKTTRLTWSELYGTLSDEFVVASFKLSLGASCIAALINSIFGLIVAWVLVRYPFPGRRLLDALVDIPFALPTAVAGLTFADLYAPNGWVGHLSPHLQATGSRAGIVIVLVFVGLPFIVRTVQPVLQDLEPEFEEAAASLGASRWYTFRRVIFPHLFPAWLAGLSLSFARALGEYGSVIFISRNIPGQSQIVPQQIWDKLADFRYAQATAIAVALLLISLSVLLVINMIDYWSRRHELRGSN